MKTLKISVISGKGGTGKTLISSNLALFLRDAEKTVQLLDADAEEPNASIFFDIEEKREFLVIKKIPKVDPLKCTGCGLCSSNCMFSAIHATQSRQLVFENLCHGCGLCMRICPEKAITEEDKVIGIVRTGKTKEGIFFSEGELNVGELSAVPVIRQLKKTVIPEIDIAIFDAPPGSSCPVVETLNGTDFALLVTEPTPFGMHDLNSAVEVVKTMGIPYAVVLNRYDSDSIKFEQIIQSSNSEIIARLPFEKRIAESYSKGKLFLAEMPEYKKVFADLYSEIERKLYK